VASETSSTAASKASVLALEGARYPDTFRTNCRAAARTSSSEADAGPRKVLMLLHMPKKNIASYPNLGNFLALAPASRNRWRSS
jgi:hypothetical protein